MFARSWQDTNKILTRSCKNPVSFFFKSWVLNLDKILTRSWQLSKNLMFARCLQDLGNWQKQDLGKILSRSLQLFKNLMFARTWQLTEARSRQDLKILARSCQTLVLLKLQQTLRRSYPAYYIYIDVCNILTMHNQDLNKILVASRISFFKSSASNLCKTLTRS